MPRVAHFEIHASEPKKVQEFYSGMFGWKFQSYGPPDSYWLIMTESGDEPGINGGLVPRRGPSAGSGQPVNAYVCTIMVDSARDSATKAASLGATEALPLMAIPGVGWLVYMKDPDGNIFGMMQADTAAA
jgi:predicted enzyme related to lactoylglutathione lyase